MRGRVLRVVGRREERTPAGLLDRRRVPVVEAGHRAEAVAGHRRRVDRRHRPPEQVVVLGARTWRSSRRRRPRWSSRAGDWCAARRGASAWRCCGRGRCTGGRRWPSRRARSRSGPSVRVVLVAAPSDFTSLNAATHCGLDSDGGGAGWNWSGALEQERPHVRHPRRLRGRVRARRQPPDAGPGRQRRERRGRGDRRLQSVAGALAQHLVRRQPAVHDPVALRRPGGDRGERGVVERRQIGRSCAGK